MKSLSADTKAGSLVKFISHASYATLNKIVNGRAFLDGQTYSVPISWLEEDAHCIKYNNPKPRSEVKMEQKQAELKITTGIKNDAGKAPISLIPSDFITGTAAVFNFGKGKYGKDNFRSGLAHSRCLDAAMRHILAIANGEELDPESGLPHVYHAACSLSMYDYMRINHPSLNDIYEITKKGLANEQK